MLNSTTGISDTRTWFTLPSATSPSAQSCFPNEYAKHNSIASAEIKEIEFNMSNLTSNLKLRTLLLQNCVAWFLVFDWFSNSVIMRRGYFLFWKSFDSLSGLWGVQMWRITAKNFVLCIILNHKAKYYIFGRTIISYNSDVTP